MEDFDPTIDEQRLDTEWLRQAAMVFSIGKRLAEATKQLTLTKNKQKAFAAELSHEIRSNPGAYGLTKVTENALDNAILANETHAKMSQNLVQLQYDVDMLTGADKALIHKRVALQNLTDLLGRHYIADREWKPKQKERRSGS